MRFSYKLLDSILHLRTIELKTILHLRKKVKFTISYSKTFLRLFVDIRDIYGDIVAILDPPF